MVVSLPLRHMQFALYACTKIVISSNNLYRCLSRVSQSKFQDLCCFRTLRSVTYIANHQGHSLRWLYNILKVSINSVEPGIHAITDLDYGSLAFYLNKTCMSILTYLGIFCFSKQCRAYVYVFVVITDLDHG